MMSKYQIENKIIHKYDINISFIYKYSYNIYQTVIILRIYEYIIYYNINTTYLNI